MILFMVVGGKGLTQVQRVFSSLAMEHQAHAND